MLEYTGRTQASAGNTISVPLLNVTDDPCIVEFDHELIDTESGISTRQVGELGLTVVATEEVEEARLPLPTSKARVPMKTALGAFNPCPEAPRTYYAFVRTKGVKRGVSRYRTIFERGLWMCDGISKGLDKAPASHLRS